METTRKPSLPSVSRMTLPRIGSPFRALDEALRLMGDVLLVTTDTAESVEVRRHGPGKFGNGNSAAPGCWEVIDDCGDVHGPFAARFEAVAAVLEILQ